MNFISSQPVRTSAGLLFILVIALFFRIHKSENIVATNDEIISLCMSSGYWIGYDTIPDASYMSEVFTNSYFQKQNNLAGVAKATIKDNGNSVIYYYGLRCWGEIIGINVIHARWFSAIIGLLILVLIYYIVNATLGRPLAFVSKLKPDQERVSTLMPSGWLKV